MFNKINQLRTQESSHENIDKNAMYERARQDIKDLEAKKQEYLDIHEKIMSHDKDLPINREEYSNALKQILAIFEDEESVGLLEGQGIEGTKDLLEKYPDTDEVVKFSSAESVLKENLANLKEMKKGIIGMFNIKNPDYTSLNGVIQVLQMQISKIDGQIFDRSVDTPEGRGAWPISYNTGLYHKETKFERNIKENKEAQVREVYHNLGDRLDSAFLEAMKEYNTPDREEPVRFEDPHEDGTHVLARSSIRVDENTVTFTFSGGYSVIEYTLTENMDGKLNFSRTGRYKAILPRVFVDIFNEKLTQLDSHLEEISRNL